MDLTTFLLHAFLSCMTVSLGFAVGGMWAAGIPVAAGVSVTAATLGGIIAAYAVVLD